jgi:hypothetical protein
MSFGKVYAAYLLPAAVGAAATFVGYEYMDWEEWCTVLLGVALFIALWVFGSAVESEFFKEDVLDDEKPRRIFRFLFGLPALYLMTAAAAAGGFFLASSSDDWPLWTLFVSPPACGGLTLLIGSFVLLASNFRRGAMRVTLEYARKRARKRKGGSRVAIGGVDFPDEEVMAVLLGTNGSGKSTIICQLFREILPRIRPGTDARAVIYDAKTEWYGFISKLTPSPVHMLNPFDARAKRWEMCQDLGRSPASAGSLALTLVPSVEGPNAYFSNAARAVLKGIIRSFIEASPDTWTFADVILAADSKARMRAVFQRSAQNRHLIAKYLEAKEYSSIASELDTRLDPFRPIAACWQRADGISLKAWAEGSSVLLLGRDEESSEALVAMNRVIFSQLTSILLNQVVSRTRATWVILDELRELAQNLQGLSSLLTRGRGYGVRFIGGFQVKPGLDDALNPKIAAEVISMCSYLGALRCPDPETLTYLSQVFGQREVFRESKSWSSGQETVSRQLVTEPIVMPEEIAGLPRPSDLGAVRGFFTAPGIGTWRANVPFPPAPPGNLEPAFEPRPVEHQYLIDWTEKDLLRLGLPLLILRDDPRHGRGLQMPGEEEDPPPAPEGAGQRPEPKVVIPKRQRI